MSMLQRLRERKLVQWTVAYLAGAWLALEVFQNLQEGLGWSPRFYVLLVGVLAVGLIVTLVLAWYHGEQGRQRVSGPELLIIGGILLVAALLVPFVFGSDPPGGALGTAAAASSATDARSFEGLPGIAVMPFENRSPDPEDASFTGGIRDELARELSRVAGLKVVSQTAGYEDSPLTDPAIGAELRVQYLLRGSVQRAADEVQINVQLIETGQGTLVWSEPYRAELSAETLFEVQETIVTTVARELSVELSSAERTRLARARTDNDEAYDLYLRASSPDAGTGDARERVERSVDLLERAVELDSAFVDAWAMLSARHSYLHHIFADRTPARMQRAREAAQRAVDLDPTNALAQLAMAEYYSRVEKDWGQALEWLDRGRGTLHGDGWYQYLRAMVERRSGLWEAALGSWQRVVELRPQSAGMINNLAYAYLSVRHFDEAERWIAAEDSIRGATGMRALLELMRDGALAPQTEQALPPGSYWFDRGDWAGLLEGIEGVADPFVNQTDWAPLDFFRGVALRGLGREAEAVEAFTRAVDALQDRTTEVPDDPRAWATLGMAYAALGRDGEAREAGELAVQLGSVEDYDALDGPVFLFRLAVTYTWLGDHERAVDTLDGLLSVPSLYTSVRLENHAALADLHEDPRFQAVMDEHRGRVFLR